MFARHVSVKLKTNSAPEFKRIIENEILPLLRNQKGFLDEITFIAPERSLALAISLWDTKADAEAYNRAGYTEVLKGLSTVVEGTPEVETFEVSNSTFHKGAAKTV
jgi:heme-degrading monooxygenase HmoA